MYDINIPNNFYIIKITIPYTNLISEKKLQKY